MQWLMTIIPVLRRQRRPGDSDKCEASLAHTVSSRTVGPYNAVSPCLNNRKEERREARKEDRKTERKRRVNIIPIYRGSREPLLTQQDGSQTTVCSSQCPHVHLLTPETSAYAPAELKTGFPFKKQALLPFLSKSSGSEEHYTTRHPILGGEVK